MACVALADMSSTLALSVLIFCQVLWRMEVPQLSPALKSSLSPVLGGTLIWELLLQAMAHRPDGKMYRIHTPQTPLARTHRYDAYKMDEYPNGTNAIVAVLSYTGQLCKALLHSVMLCLHLLKPRRCSVRQDMSSATYGLWNESLPAAGMESRLHMPTCINNGWTPGCPV